MLKSAVSFATLFMSLGTLVCCALPALFVALGAGATFVSLLGVFPQLIWFSEHKGGVFITAGVLLVGNVLMSSFVPPQCPADPALAAECQRAQRLSAVLLYVSIMVYLIGVFFAFLAPFLVT